MDLVTYNSESHEVNLKIPGKKWIFTPILLNPTPLTSHYENDPDRIPEHLLLAECTSQTCYLRRNINTLRRELTIDIAKRLPKTGGLTITSLFPGSLGFEAGLLHELGDRDVNLYLIGFPDGDEFKKLLAAPQTLETSLHLSGRDLSTEDVEKRKIWFHINVRRLKVLMDIFPRTRVFVCDRGDDIPKADALLLIDFLDECTPREMLDEKYVKETFFDRYGRTDGVIGVAVNDFPKGAGTIVRVNGKDTGRFAKRQNMVWYYLIRDLIATIWLLLTTILSSLIQDVLSR